MEERNGQKIIVDKGRSTPKGYHGRSLLLERVGPTGKNSKSRIKRKDRGEY